MKTKSKLIILIVFIVATYGLLFVGNEATGDSGMAPDAANKPITKAQVQQVVKGLKSISVLPQNLKLSGANAKVTLIVTGTYNDGSQRDLTRYAKFSSKNSRVATVASDGLVSAVGNGQAILQAEVKGKKAKTNLTVSDTQKTTTVHFINDLVPLFTRMGCNAGSCHGALKGQNGFKLSLFGYDPEADYQMIVKEDNGRRITRTKPEDSLILLKPTFTVAHGGGQRFEPGSLEYRMLLDWIKAGAPFDTKSPRIERIAVLPSERILVGRGEQQQLVVLGQLSDGTTRDLTKDVKYISNDEGIATVEAQGRVTARHSGETAIMARALGQVAVARLMVITSPPMHNYPALPANNYIDELVFAKLRKLNMVPSNPCTDSEFVRRAYLDTIGRVPTLDETTEFLTSEDPQKRSRLINELLGRPEYADFWAVIWGDLLRNSRRYVLEKGAYTFQRWLRNSLAANEPFDRFAHDLLTAVGSGYREGPPNYFRVSTTPEDAAITTSQLFLGVRIECARCHNHPLEKWTQDDFYGLSAFFARVRRKGSEQLNENIVYVTSKGELNNPKTKAPVKPKFLGGPTIGNTDDAQDRRAVLADWITAPNNPFFARAVVNRLWRHFMGRGIVEPADDFRSTNPPVNEPLLDALAKDFVAKKYDVKQIMRTILNSRTYQLSAQPNATNQDDTTQFSHHYVKKLMAEQLLDAVTQVTGVDEKFGGYPSGTHAMQLSDPAINSYFLKTFGRTNRDIICERSQEPSLAQALHMISGDTINNKISSKNNRLERWLNAKKSDKEIIESFYLAALCRRPEPNELTQLEQYVVKAKTKREGLEDVLWTLLNSKEFNTNH
jgi:hypothetical protein